MINARIARPGRGVASQDTKGRILDAAERLFASQGVEGVSVRTILAEAGVNVALAHYHFGGREGLISEVMRRRIEPLNERRLRLLEEAEAGAPARPPDLESVLRAFFAPVIELMDEQPDVSALIGRLHIAADSRLRENFLELSGEVVSRFGVSIRNALRQDLSESQQLSRAFFTFGVLIHTLTSHADMALVAGDVRNVPHGEVLLREMVDYCAAGLRAPVKRSRMRGKTKSAAGRQRVRDAGVKPRRRIHRRRRTRNPGNEESGK